MAKTKQPETQLRKYLARMIKCPVHGQSLIVNDPESEKPLCAVYTDGSYYCYWCGARGKVDG